MRKRRLPKRRLKKKKWNPFPFLFLCVLIFSAVFFLYQPPLNNESANTILTTEGDLTEEAKEEDLNYFFKVIEENYPYLTIDESYNDIKFLDHREEYIKQTKSSQNDAAYFSELQKISEILGSEVKFLTKREYDEFLKYENISSLKLWIDTLKQDHSAKRYRSMPLTEQSEEKEDLTMTTPIPGEIAYLKIKDFNPLTVDSDGEKIKEFLQNLNDYQSLIIDIRDNQGISVDYFLENLVIPLSNNYYKSTSTLLEKGDQYTSYLESYQNNYFTVLPEKSNIGELKKEFSLPDERAKQFQYGKQYSIRIEPNKETIFKGKIYLLQNINTKYAADTFSQFANQTGFAETVGTTTGGNGVNIANVFFTLPHSGFVFQMPVGMGLNQDGSSNYERGTEPILNYPDNDRLLNILVNIIQS